MNERLFYCYSKRMMYFLKSMKFGYEDELINSKTNTKYWTFKKSSRLDKAILLWNEIKYTI